MCCSVYILNGKKNQDTPAKTPSSTDIGAVVNMLPSLNSEVPKLAKHVYYVVPRCQLHAYLHQETGPARMYCLVDSKLITVTSQQWEQQNAWLIVNVGGERVEPIFFHLRQQLFRRSPNLAEACFQRRQTGVVGADFFPSCLDHSGAFFLLLSVKTCGPRK